MIRFFDFLINSNLFISVCALSLYLFYSLVMKVNFFLSTPVMVFCFTYLGYHLLRLVPYKRGLPVHHHFTSFYEKNSWITYITLLLSLVIGVIALFDLTPLSLSFLIVSGILVVTYEKVLFKNFDLRMLPYLKPFIISLVWALVATAMNGVFESGIFLECYVFILLLSIPFDIKDLEYDQRMGLKSLPMLFKGKEIYVLGGAYFFYCVISFYFLREWFLPISFIIYIAFLKLAKKLPRLYYLGFDGLIILRLIFYLLDNSHG